MSAGNEKILVRFAGEGHTKDNVIVYLPQQKILFGGCLIKELNASKGNLDDANVTAWRVTVEKIRKKFPDVQTVIPGHGLSGDQTLLDYIINLFESN